MGLSLFWFGIRDVFCIHLQNTSKSKIFGTLLKKGSDVMSSIMMYTVRCAVRPSLRAWTGPHELEVALRRVTSLQCKPLRPTCLPPKNNHDTTSSVWATIPTFYTICLEEHTWELSVPYYKTAVEQAMSHKDWRALSMAVTKG